MGEILGQIVGSVVDAIGDAIDRKSIAKALRGVAGQIERGDIVPDAMLARAKKRVAQIKAARAQYNDG